MVFNLLFDLFNLRRNQWLPTEKLEEIQNRKLRKIIKHAYENVTYYNKLFDSVGVKPEDIKNVKDLQKIPITTKQTIQSLPISEITAKNVDLSKCIIERTSGSSDGVPLTIYYCKKDKIFLDSIWARAKLANGQRIKDKWVSIRNPLFLHNQKRWLENLGIWRRFDVSCFDDIKHQLDIIRKINPEVITGYPSSFLLLANQIQNKRNKNINPRLIFTIGELIDKDSKKSISSIFEAKLFDFYAAFETGLIAWECNEKKGYHINIDSVVVEFIWNGKLVSAGERSKIICTNLHSYVMPFIRYEIGDIGVKSDEKCPCGRGLPLMNNIEGRLNDFLILSNGKIIHPFLVTSEMRDTPGISRYQIIQEKKDKLVIKIIKNKEFTQDTITSIKRNLKKVLEKDIRIEVKTVNNIPRDKSGKFRVVLSKINVFVKN